MTTQISLMLAVDDAGKAADWYERALGAQELSSLASVVGLRGADGSADEVRDHETPWGPHRQGGFRDPFGHVWLVGDKTRPQPFPRD